MRDPARRPRAAVRANARPVHRRRAARARYGARPGDGRRGRSRGWRRPAALLEGEFRPGGSAARVVRDRRAAQAAAAVARAAAAGGRAGRAADALGRLSTVVARASAPAARGPRRAARRDRAAAGRADPGVGARARDPAGARRRLPAGRSRHADGAPARSSGWASSRSANATGGSRLYLTDHLRVAAGPPPTAADLDRSHAPIARAPARRMAPRSSPRSTRRAGGGYPGETVDALVGPGLEGLVTNDTLHALRAFAAPPARSAPRDAQRTPTVPLAPARAAGGGRALVPRQRPARPSAADADRMGGGDRAAAAHAARRAHARGGGRRGGRRAASPPSTTC